MTTNGETKALTAKQSRFVEEYLCDLNATQAAIRAGYAPLAAQEQGSRLLSNAMVQAAVAEAKKARSERTKVNADTVLARLAEALEADLADLYDEHQNLKPVAEWPLVWRKGLVAGLDVEELFDGRGEDREHIGRVRKIRLADRIRLIELIGKHVDVGAFRERVEHEGLAALVPTIVINGKPA